MKRLVLKQQEDRPAIILLPDKAKFQIIGGCWPEDTKKFFEPIFKWFEEYFENQPLPETNVEMQINYFNTSCLLAIKQLIVYLLEMSKKHKIKIFWYYYPTDDEILDDGIRFWEILGKPKNFILVPLNNQNKIKLIP